MWSPLSGAMTFREAGEKWLEARTFGKIRSKVRYCAPKTLKFYTGVITILSRFFAELALSEIHLGHIEAYRLERSDSAIGNTIRQEEHVLISILKRAGVWTPQMDEDYVPIQYEERDIPKALSPAEQDYWLETSRSKPRWQIVHWYSLVAFRTTAGGCEMRGLKLQDVNLYQQIVTIQSRHAKNKFRIRSVPLPPDALWAIERLMERAKSCGSVLPHHYLFPFQYSHGGKTGDVYEPEKPMSEWGIHTLWLEVQQETGLPWFTQKHTRHTGITRFAEAGVPIAVIQDLAGHMSAKMTKHYTQISNQARQKAIMAVYEGRMYEEPERKPVQNVQKRPNSLVVNA